MFDFLRLRRGALMRPLAALLLCVNSSCPSNILDNVAKDFQILVGDTDPVAPGGAGVLPLLVVRKNGFVGPIYVSGQTAGLGITWSDLTIAADESTAELPFTVSPAVTEGSYSLILYAGDKPTGSPGWNVGWGPVGAVKINVVKLGSYVIGFAGFNFLFPTLYPGSEVDVAVQLARTDFTGTVTLTTTAEGGIVATITSGAVLSGSATDAFIHLSVPLSATVGQFKLMIKGNSPGTAERQKEQAMTLAATQFGLTVEPTSVDIVTGSSKPVRVYWPSIGGFAGTLSLSSTATGGLSVTHPATLPPGGFGLGEEATIAAPPGTLPGPYTVTFRATYLGVPDKTATVTVNVTPLPVANVTWTFCPASGVPVWVAVQDGAGAWTRATGNGNVYAFAVTAGKGGIAYVVTGTSIGTDLRVFYGSLADLQTTGAYGCASGTGPMKTITGTASNFGTATGSMAYATLGPYTSVADLFNAALQFRVPPGPFDLVGARFVSASPSVVHRVFMRRSVNLLDGGSVGTLDYLGAEVAPPAIATLTLAGLNGETASVSGAYHTSNNPLSFFYSDGGPTAAASRPIYGYPGPLTIFGDLHYINASARVGFHPTATTRVVGTFFGAVADQSLTLGPALSGLSVQSLGNSSMTANYVVQTEYANYWMVNYTQHLLNRTINVEMTRAYLGSGTTAPLLLPNFSTVSGWNTAWGLQPGGLTDWMFSASGWTGTGGVTFSPFAAGSVQLGATKQGQITP